MKPSMIAILAAFLLMLLFLLYTVVSEQNSFQQCLLNSTWTVEKQEVEKIHSDAKGYKVLQWKYELSCDDDPDVLFTYTESRPNWYLISSKLRFNIQVIDTPEIPKPGEQ